MVRADLAGVLLVVVEILVTHHPVLVTDETERLHRLGSNVTWIFTSLATVMSVPPI